MSCECVFEYPGFLHICYASQQNFCRGAGKVLGWYEDFATYSDDFDTAQEITIRCDTA